jgi:acyl-CoA thioesterase
MTSNPTRPDPADRLAADTQLELVAPGTYAAQINAGWWVIQGPNGGYIAALLLRALDEAVAEAVGHFDRTARSLTVHYTSPPVEGPARIETSVERSGRSLSTVTARLWQGEKLRAISIAAFSVPRNGPEMSDVRMPEFPPASQLEVSSETFIPMNERYETRFIPGTGRGAGNETAITAAWIRPKPAARSLDAQLLAAYSDALPPAVFALSEENGPFGAVPTIDLTVHFRNSDAWRDIGPEDSCLVVMRSRLSEQGFVEEDGEIWSPGGLLLAHSRQLALVLNG